ncbi:MAG: putative tRNA sulfurtransferase [Candidatus Binatia bacterium]|nr:MAG: putative tRNA sulfurtransferase [Candidatus Binatia bacterium]
MECFVVHYHEVALKKGNRFRFVEQLVGNLRRALRGTGAGPVAHVDGRIVVPLPPGADEREISERIGRTYGVVHSARGLRVPPDLESIVSAARKLAVEGSFESFAVRAKRSDKRFPVPSPEICRIVGAAIRERTGARVSLGSPERVFQVEVTSKGAFVLGPKSPGPGGLPVGTGGKVLALLSGGIDSPVAAARMMQRGCRVDFVHFHAVPLQDRRAIEKTREIVELLVRSEYECRLFLVPLAALQREIVCRTPRPARVVLYRRMMLRIAEALARRHGLEALVTGESLGQVASQTLANLVTIDEVATLPVLRPLIGMDKQEITDQAKRLGTFEISVRPDQDCCQLFVPRHPSTRVSPEQARALEAALDVPGWVERTVERTEPVSFRFPPDQEELPLEVGRSAV